MKLIRTLIILLIIALLAFVGIKVYMFNAQKAMPEADEFTFTYTGGGTIELNINAHFDRAKVRINDKPVIAEEIKQPGNTILSFPLDTLEHDELLTFEITMLNASGDEVGKRLLQSVCVSTGGVVPEYGMETLVLYDYTGDEFPSFNTKELGSLFVLYSKNTDGNISLDYINESKNLESLYIVSYGAVAGELQSLKSLHNLRRIVIVATGKVGGELDDIDDLTLLTTLHLENIQAAGVLKDISPLTDLRELKLVNCRYISGDIKWLKKLEELRVLHIEGCSTGGDISELGELKHLESLVVK